ncbi:hypothetical protein E2C01_032309 [Portunus trituberculatus]|uniref:Uncharacterized protein n=1 Tax=Portunus trituberculatus TaxID=210409 RepID=A0A5B7F109_PORTR|nr:hypothetical protein [Portunus trituberculatus]
MKNLSVDPQVCGKQYHRLINSVDPAEKLEFEDSIRQQCCAFHNYLLCVTTAAERECSSEASYFIEEYSYRTARPIIQDTPSKHYTREIRLNTEESQPATPLPATCAAVGPTTHRFAHKTDGQIAAFLSPLLLLNSRR